MISGLEASLLTFSYHSIVGEICRDLPTGLYATVFVS